MEKKKTGWAGIESRKKAPSPKEQHKTAVRAAKISKKPAAKPKESKPPYGVLIGRRTVDGEYLLDRQSYDTPGELGAFVTAVLKNETHEQGLREIMVHLRPLPKVKEGK